MKGIIPLLVRSVCTSGRFFQFLHIHRLKKILARHLIKTGGVTLMKIIKVQSYRPSAVG